jgi:hypothetical protein
LWFPDLLDLEVEWFALEHEIFEIFEAARQVVRKARPTRYHKLGFM